MNKIMFTWNDLDKSISNIVQQIKEKNLKIDVIMGIPRGGLILAVMISHKLNVPLILDPSSLGVNKKLLIIDDISDTGTTLERTLNAITPLNHAYKPITATIHYKVGSKVIPDIYHIETKDWIVYPWETLDTSKADYIL